MSASRRIFLDKQDPEIFAALTQVAEATSRALESAGLGRDLAELVNVRVSQIHACAFCLNLHTRRAEKAGASGKKLATLPAWRDTELFTPQERAALTLAEMVAERPEITDSEQYETCRALLGDEGTSAIVWTAITISSFNAVSIMSGHPVR